MNTSALTKCVSLIVLLSLYSGCSKQTYNDGTLTAGEISTFGSIFNIHGSTIKYLQIGDKRFEDVRGYVPYFLKLPDTSLILFVTDEGPSKTQFHIADLQTGKVLTIEGGYSRFGNHIGSTADAMQQQGEWIESYNAPRLTIRSLTVSGENVITLNLETRKLESDLRKNVK